MTEFDKEYLELIKKIIEEGVEVQNRTGINTIKIPEHSFHFDLQKEFPILTVKKTAFKTAIIEMLWIWQMQSNDVRDLHERGVHIWDEWMIDHDGIYRIYEPEGEYNENKEVIVYDANSSPIDRPGEEMAPKLNSDGTVMKAKSLIPGKTIREARYYGPEYANTIGTAYGFITNRYKFTQNLINKIKNAPTDRRLVYSLWQNEFLRTAVLPSCVWSTEWGVTAGKLNLLVHQRSCDVPLGLPFNITQYATFLKMIAEVTGLEAGTIQYSIKDAHIYKNQLPGIEELLKREKIYTSMSHCTKHSTYEFKKYLLTILPKLEEKDPLSKEYQTQLKMCDMILNPEKPELWLDSSIDNFFDYDNSRELKHCKIKKYKSMGKVDFPITQ